jgi:rhomboid protease GluP
MDSEADGRDRQTPAIAPRPELPEFLRGSSPGTPPSLPPVDERQKMIEFHGAMVGLSSTPTITITLIVVNVLIYLAMGIDGAGWFTIGSEAGVRWGADFWMLTTSGQWWRLITSAFVHFGLIHIAFNMWALYQAGGLTERLFGRLPYVLLYLYGALISGLASIWWNPNNVCAGASGAIFAVFGALLAYLLLHRNAFPRSVVEPLSRSTLVFIGYNIFFGLTQKDISNSAHVGGLISGFVIGLILARPLDPVRRRRQTWPRLLAGVIAIIASVGAGIYAIPKASPDDVSAQLSDDPAAAFNQGVHSTAHPHFRNFTAT